MSVSCVLYALGLLSNGSAIVLPVMVFAHGWISGGAGEGQERAGAALRLKRAWRSAVVYTPVAAVYLFIRYKVAAGQSQPMAMASLSNWLLTLPSVLFFYARNWFFPARLSGFYDLYYQSHLSWAHVVAPAVIVVALGGGVWCLAEMAWQPGSFAGRRLDCGAAASGAGLRTVSAG